MPYLPNINAGAPSRAFTNTFLGINATDSNSDGESKEERGMCSDYYPALATWKGPSYVQALTAPAGILGKDSLCLLDNGKVFFGSTETGLTVSMDSSMLPKQLVSMGAYLCIWPDKKYLNTALLTDYGSMDASWAAVSGGTVKIQMCRLDGTDYDSLGQSIAVSPIAPEDPANGALWIDTSGSTHVLMQWSEVSGTWSQVATTYLKITASGLGANFSEYDTVTIKNLGALAALDETLSDEAKAQLAFLDGDMIVYASGTNYIVVAGILDHSAEISSYDSSGLAVVKLEVSRDVPDLDYITESNNRLWGCKYGMVNGQTVNEIYASKLGDFKNWHSFMGLSTDSYTVSVGTDGKFTGACTLRGVPMFWKEECVHKVSGTSPSSYTMTTTMLRGVEEGSERSMVIVNETLFYKGRTDIMAYDGSLPQGIGTPLGPVLKTLHHARAGAFGGKYWICAQAGVEDGDWMLFCWDSQRGAWHQLQNQKIDYFAPMDDSLYAIRDEGMSTYTLLDLQGVDGTASWPGDMMSLCVLGPFGYETEDQKYLGRMNIRVQLAPGSEFGVFACYDGDADAGLSSGDWVQLGGANGPEIIYPETDEDEEEPEEEPEEDPEPIYQPDEIRTVMLPILPRRCDHFMLGFGFNGFVKVLSIGRVYMGGADGP